MPLSRLLDASHYARTLAVSAACLAPASALAEFDAREVAGAPGDAFIAVRANEFTSNAQDHPSVAVDPMTGCSLTVWGSRRQEQGGYGVFGRLIDSSGRTIGGEIHLNQYFTNNQQDPAVAFGPDGTAWVAWQSYLQDGDQGSIIMRRFGVRDGRLTALGDEFIVNDVTVGDQTSAAVAVGEMHAMVTWLSRDGAKYVASGRIFDREGRAVTEEFDLVERLNDAAAPVVAAQPDGSFVVACTIRRPDGSPRGLVGQRFDAEGRPIGAAFPVAEDDEAHHVEPAIDVDSRGQFVLAWMRQSETRGWDVVARQFHPDGTPAGASIVVDRSAADAWKSGVDVSVADDGRFVVAYNGEAAGPAQTNTKNPHTPAMVLAQRFDAEGSRIGKPTRVGALEEGRQALSIGVNARRSDWRALDDSFIVAWEGAIDGDTSGVGISTLTSDHPRRLVARRAVSGVDGSILAAHTLVEAGLIDRFPPDYDPFFVPEPPDRNILNPGTDFGFQGFQATGWNPPDPDLAVGPNHVVVAVNGGIRFYTKDGTLTFADDISGANGFWGEVGANSFVFDPVCVFDVDSQRFIVVCTEHADNGDDVIDLAVSDDDDPNGDWHKYRFIFSSVGDFIDFPNLGVGPDAIYVCCDYFSGNTGNRIHIFNKQHVMNGQATTPNVVTTSGGFRSLGSVNHLTADAPAQYFATSFDGSNSQIGIDAIRNPNGTPLRNNFLLSVPSFSQPPDAEQLGTSNRAATVDMRIKNGVYRDGLLYLAHTIGQSSTARVRWYQIQMNGWPTSGQNPQLLDSGTQNLGAGIHNWFPDISVDDNHVVGVAFNQSSSSEYISVQRTFRLPTDPAGTLRTPNLMQVSNSPENGSRWGDYGGVEQDPVEPGVFWNHHEYRTSSWRTWVGRFDVMGDLLPLGFAYPDGLPAQIDSDGGTTFLMEVLAGTSDPQPGTGVLHVDRGGGYETFPMTDLGNNLYEATFPSTPCGSSVSFYVSAESTEGDVVTDPVDAPTSAFSAESYADFDVAFADDFETDQGWTVENIDLADGQWTRGVPAGGGSRGDPPTDFDGSGQCYLTDNVAGNSDVDGGPTRLISPVFDLAGASNVTVSYARWFYNDDGDNDRLTVEISNNGGSTWTLVESVADSGSGGWFEFSFDPATLLSLTDQMRLRFSATDNPNDSVTEAAVDAVRVSSSSCADTQLTGFQVTNGTLLGGGLPELVSSDDAYLSTRSGFGATLVDLHNVELLVTAATTSSSPSTVDVSVETRISHPSGSMQVRLRNWNTNAFDLVGTFAINQTDQSFVVNGADAANYVSGGGEVELRIKQIVFVPQFAFLFDSFFDVIEVDVN